MYPSWGNGGRAAAVITRREGRVSWGNGNEIEKNHDYDELIVAHMGSVHDCPIFLEKFPIGDGRTTYYSCSYTLDIPNERAK